MKSVRKFKKIQLKLVIEKIYDKSELTKIRFVIKEGLEMILINIPYIKFGMLSTILVLCTIMLSTIDAGQIPVFAQNSISTLNNPPITPVPNLGMVMMVHHQAMIIITKMMLATMNLRDYLDLTMMAVTMKATPKNDHQAMTVTHKKHIKRRRRNRR